MKKILSIKLEKNLPVFIGTIIIFSGIIHILVSACFLVKFPLRLYGDFREYINLSAYTNVGILIGIFLGFCLIILGKGICERRKKSWYIAVIILVASCVNNFWLNAAQQTAYLTIILLFLLIIFKRFFNKKSEIAMGYQQILAWFSITIAFAYGVTGSYFLREEFHDLKTWTDAVYFTMVTYSTVGFGDIYPITQEAKIFTVSMILVGLGSFATTFTFLIGPMIENRMKGVLSIMKRINNIHDHIILCGYTPLCRALIKQFEEKRTPFVIIENSHGKKEEIKEEVGENCTVLAGNSFQKETFINAGIESAKAVIITFESDSDNILTILTAKEILEEFGNKKTKLISRIDYEDNIDKAKKLGATEIVSPTTMAASFIVDCSLD